MGLKIELAFPKITASIEGEIVLRESVGLKTKELDKAEELAIETNSLSYRNGMNTLINSPASARHSNGNIVVVLESGIEFSFPCSAYPRLAAATDEERANIELSPMGIHWPELDEDLSIRGLVRDHGQART